MLSIDVLSSSLKQFYPQYWAQILGFWVTCGVKMMSLHHGWGWQPPQTASRIHIRHIQSVWAHWYVVHKHTVAALHSQTTYFLAQMLGVWVTCESKWWRYIMVEADSHRKLLHASILDIQHVWAHWYAVHRHRVTALHCYHPDSWLGIKILGSNFWDPHQKQNSNSVSDSKNPGQIYFWGFQCWKLVKLEFWFAKFGILLFFFT
jgi:hypothetical protein